MAELVSLTDLKAFMQVTVTTSDTLISLYRDFVEAEVEAYVGRQLDSQSYTQYLYYQQSTYDRGHDTYLEVWPPEQRLYLKNYPITALTLVEDSVTVSTSDYYYNADNGVLTGKRIFTTQDNKLVANFTAGYTTATCPADLAGVVKLGVASLYNNNVAAKQGSGNVSSKKIKDFAVSYGNETTGYLASGGYGSNHALIKVYIESNKHILNRYKQVNL